MTQQLERCRVIQEVWCKLQEENVKNRSSFSNDFHPIYIQNNVPKNVLDSCNSLKSRSEVKLLPCVSDTLDYIKKKTEDEAHKCHVFVTGSLHLIGTVLSVLDPDLTLATSQFSGGIGVSAANSTHMVGSSSS